MKGSKLIVKILTYFVLVMGLFLAAISWYLSWSQNDTPEFSPFLRSLLGGIMVALFIRSFTHPERNRALYRIGRTEARVEHLNRYAGFFFFGILLTPVEYGKWIPEDSIMQGVAPYIETAHLVFTFLAITTLFLELWKYYKSKVGKAVSRSAVVICSVQFGAAFLLHTHTVGWSEFFCALPFGIHILTTNK